MKLTVSSQFVIGDYVKSSVSCHFDKIFQISAITKAKVGVHEVPDKMLYIRNNEICCIPITEEFLYLNGFKNNMQNYAYEQYYTSDTLSAHVKINKVDNEFNVFAYNSAGDFICKKGVKHIHEFQHILRMINFSSVANNFIFND